MPNNESLLIIVVAIAFGFYRRVRRTIGFQILSPGWMLFRVLLFLVLFAVIVYFTVAGQAASAVYLWDLVGIVLGAMLVYVAIRQTTFEQANGKWRYRTNTWVGLLVTVLFVGRLALRFGDVEGALSGAHAVSDASLAPASAAAAGNPFAGGAGFASGTPFATSDPWSSGLYMLFAAYYIGYYGYLLWEYRQRQPRATLG